MKYIVNYTREITAEESGYMVVAASNLFDAEEKAREALLDGYAVEPHGDIEKWDVFGTEYLGDGIRIVKLEVEGGDED